MLPTDSKQDNIQKFIPDEAYTDYNIWVVVNQVLCDQKTL